MTERADQMRQRAKEAEEAGKELASYAVYKHVVHEARDLVGKFSHLEGLANTAQQEADAAAKVAAAAKEKAEKAAKVAEEAEGKAATDKGLAEERKAAADAAKQERDRATERAKAVKKAYIPAEAQK